MGKEDVLEQIYALTPSSKLLLRPGRGLEMLVQKQLEECLEFYRWYDEEHRNRVTRKQIWAQSPFPYNLVFYPFVHRRNKQKFVDPTCLKRMSKQAKEVYHMFASKLEGSSSGWVMDSASPLLVDCLLYGHVMDCMNEPLRELLPQVLVDFAARFDQEVMLVNKQCTVRVTGRSNAFINKSSSYLLPNASVRPVPTYTKRQAMDLDSETDPGVAAMREVNERLAKSSRKWVFGFGAVFVGYLLAHMVEFEVE